MTVDRPKSEPSTAKDADSRSRSVRLSIVIGTLACIFGVGVASLGRSARKDEQSRTPQVTAILRGISPRAVELTFNPRSSRGLKVGKAAFRIRYRVAADKLETVRDRLDSQWNAIVNCSLRVFMRHTAPELKSDEGLDKILDELARAIDEAAFNDGIAEVESILLQQIIVQ
ncbi:MAG: hypothetical protein U1F36_18750 [Planctomycetota bacterium]